MNLDQHILAEQYLHEALLQLTAGMPDDALQSIRRSLSIEPGCAAARLAEARIHLVRNDAPAALRALDVRDQYHPHSCQTPQVMMLRAEALLRSDEYKLCRGLLEKLADQFPDDVRPHRMLAALHLKHGRPDHAIAHLQKILRLSASDRPSRHLLAQCLAKYQPEAAAEVLQASLADDDAPNLQLKTARLLARCGRATDADDIYAALLGDHEEEAVLWLEAGLLADTLGADQLAIERLEKTVQSTRENNTPALIALATAHMHAGRCIVAARIWWRIARGEKNNMHAWAGLVVCALAENRSRLARRTLRTLTRHTAPQERRQMLSRLWFHAAAGLAIRRTDEADNQSSEPATSPLRDMLATAAEKLQRHAEKLPRRADTHYHLAACHAAMNNRLAARQSVDTALQLNPTYTTAQHLATRLAA